jgi:hypothetical protein
MARSAMQRRVPELERRYPPPPDRQREQRRFNKVWNRFTKLLDGVESLLTPEQDQQLEQALHDGPGRKELIDGWLRNLQEGRCRLPKLSPEVMRDLLVAWLSPECNGGVVCRGCGLEYPKHRHPHYSEWKLLPGKEPGVSPPPYYDLPEFFKQRPHCGAARLDIDAAGEEQRFERPWMKLDGCVTP